jgi:hypothetical protein
MAALQGLVQECTAAVWKVSSRQAHARPTSVDWLRRAVCYAWSLCSDCRSGTAAGRKAGSVITAPILACLPPFKAWSATTVSSAADLFVSELIAMANARLRYTPTLDRNPANLPHFDIPYTGFREHGSTSLVRNLKELIDETKQALAETADLIANATNSDGHGSAATPSAAQLAQFKLSQARETFHAALADIESRTEAHFAFRIKRRSERPRGTYKMLCGSGSDGGRVHVCRGSRRPSNARVA